MRQDKQDKALGVKTPAYYRQEAWGKLAWLYDSFMKFVFLPFGGEGRFRKKFVDFASPEKGEQVMDVCSGTGTLTSLIAERVGSGGKVIGVDLSLNMIKIARGRAKFPSVSFQKANSESLPFPENTFDRSFVSLGLHEMPEGARQNTLKEIYRTLKPGGCLFALDYNLPRGVFARFTIKAFVRLLEEEPTYNMLIDGRLTAEIEEAGLTIERRELICGGMVQMIQARKAQE